MLDANTPVILCEQYGYLEGQHVRQQDSSISCTAATVGLKLVMICHEELCKSQQSVMFTNSLSQD